MDFVNPHYITPDKRFVGAVINGVVSTIPANPDNSHYAALLASGVVIADYAPPPPTTNDVNIERDRRLETFTFGGNVYQYGVKRSGPIASVGSSALGAIIDGALPGDYRWSHADRDFVWYDIDNVAVKMDAQTAWDFSKAADLWMQGHVIAARTLKDTSPIPSNYADDSLWPTAG